MNYDDPVHSLQYPEISTRQSSMMLPHHEIGMQVRIDLAISHMDALSQTTYGTQLPPRTQILLSGRLIPQLPT